MTQANTSKSEMLSSLIFLTFILFLFLAVAIHDALVIDIAPTLKEYYILYHPETSANISLFLWLGLLISTSILIGNLIKNSYIHLGSSLVSISVVLLFFMDYLVKKSFDPFGFTAIISKGMGLQSSQITINSDIALSMFAIYAFWIFSSILVLIVALIHSIINYKLLKK